MAGIITNLRNVRYSLDAQGLEDKVDCLHHLDIEIINTYLTVDT